MQAVIDFLKENPMGSLATVEAGKPRLRPWGFMLEEGGKIYFSTSNEKEAYKQLVETPFIEFSSTSKNFGWVRVSGKITFVEDLEMKAKILEANGLVKSIYKTADNPIFKIFYVEHGTAILGDFSGQPQRVLEF